MFGKAWISGEAVLGEAWNTQAFKGTISGVPDFTSSAFSGKIGVPDPRVSTSFMDWYLWAEGKWGKAILTKLAAQSPKIYTSTLPMTQAVASGEILGAPVAAGTALTLKAAGAPDRLQGVARTTGMRRTSGCILKQAPHPAAAQLLANYIESPEGQATRLGDRRRHYPNIPNTFYSTPRVQHLNDFTKAKVDAFNALWVSLFTH